jgi:hypothetical protein
MAKGALRQSIENWAHETFIAPDPSTWWGRVQKRWGDYQTQLSKFRQTQPEVTWVIQVDWWVTGLLYALFGSDWMINDITARASGVANDDMSEAIAKKLREVFSNPVTNEIAESLGAVITEPVLTMFEKYAGKDDVDPKEFARAFHGFMIALNLTGGIGSTVIEAASAGAIKGAGKMLDQMYWSLGLGFLGWQTLAPLLSSGLQPGLERYYKKLYRPQRFAASDLRDLFALGQITLDQLKEEGRLAGWRDQDLDQWVKLAYRSLSQGDVFDALHKGFMSQDEATKRLRVLGFDPADLPLIFKLNPAPEVNDAHSFSVSTARNAYKQQLISKEQLTTILKGLKYTDLEINTLIALADLDIAQAVKSLTIGQLKEAWTENVVNDTEARHWMSEEGMSGAQQDILMATWKAELTPDFRKLNSGTITAAYVEGILTRSDASTHLQAIGYSSDDAILQLDLTEKRNPEAFGAAAPPPVRTLAPGTLSGLVGVGLITPDQMKTRLIQLGYTDADASLLSEAARIRATPSARLLPQASTEKAYIAGVITREQATQRLLDIGYDQPTAAVILDTDEQQNAGVFAQPPAERVLTLTPGVLSDLVIVGLMTPDTMQARLIDLGYTEEDAKLLVERAGALATPLPRILTKDNITQAYLYGVFDRTTALARLISIDYTEADANTILDTFEAANPAVFHPELVQSIRMPSISALATAVYNGLITEDEFFARAQEIGYSPQDAALYLRPAVDGSQKPIKTLTAAQVLSVYDHGLFSKDTTITRLEALGYDEADATLLLRITKDLIVNTDAWDSLLAGSIDPMTVVAQLISQNYSDQDIINAFSSLPPATLAAMNINLEDLAAALAITPGGA